jgi:glycosyltransferase involved in cell wall biosynthesis
MGKKKVVLVIPSLSAGGMERVMSELATFFATRNEIVTYLIVYTKGDHFYKVPENVILIEPKFSFVKKYKLFYTFKTLYFLRREIQKIRPDAVLSFGETYNSFVLAATLFLNTRIFVSDRSKPDKTWGNFHETLRRIIYKNAAGIVSQTSFSKSFLEKETGHKNIEIIPNPVKPNYVTNETQDKVILTVGRLISTKKIDLLLEIFSETSKDNWKLWVVGDGPERKNLEILALKLGIYEQVTFWGFQKDVESFYAKSKIFAFTSISEGFPNALLEAMAAGLPCVSFDCIAGPSDIITNGENGYLIPILDFNTYKTQLDHLMNNEILRSSMGETARAVSKLYNVEKIGNAYLKFLLS